MNNVQNNQPLTQRPLSNINVRPKLSYEQTQQLVDSRHKAGETYNEICKDLLSRFVVLKQNGTPYASIYSLSSTFYSRGSRNRRKQADYQRKYYEKKKAVLAQAEEAKAEPSKLEQIRQMLELPVDAETRITVIRALIGK